MTETNEAGSAGRRGTEERSAAGPVGAGDPPPPAGAKAVLGAVPPSPRHPREMRGAGRAGLSMRCLPTPSGSGMSTWTSPSGPRPTSRTSASGWRPRFRPRRLAGKAELLRDVVPVLDDLGAGASGGGVGSGGGFGGWAGAWGAARVQELAGLAESERGRGCGSEGGEVRSDCCMRRSRRSRPRESSRASSSR